MVLTDSYKQVLRNWFGKEESGRKFLDYVVKILENKWNDKNIFIIEAPTGYGKSVISATISLFSLKDENSLKCIVAFPLRTLLEDQYCKFVGDYNSSCEGKNSILGKVNPELRLAIIGKRYMHNPDSPYLIKPITLTTVDTLSLTLFGIPPESLDRVVREWDGTIGGSLGHYLFAWGSVVFSNVVLDEVHLLADSTKSLSFLIALMKIAIDFDQKLVLMSATIPDSLKKVIIEYAEKFGFLKKICMINFVFGENEKKCDIMCNCWDDEFVKDRLEKEYEILIEKVTEENKFDEIIEWLKSNSEFRRVIVLFNTVKEAIDFYESKIDSLTKLFGKSIVLLHSRFTEKDRQEKIDMLRNLRERDAYLLISTQIIEAGIDISSNLFITDVAPANSLIQRLGRFLRYPHKDGEGNEDLLEKRGKIIIWYETDEKGELLSHEIDDRNKNKRFYKVYDYDLTSKTLEWLKENSKDVNGKRVVNLNVHVPEIIGNNSEKKGYRELLNQVYDVENKDRYFTVNEDIIRDFEGIFLHLENASLIATEKFFEMEGSFVRDELQIPIVPKSRLESLEKDGIINKNPIEFARQYVVPVPLSTFRSKNVRNNISGVVIIETDDRSKRDLVKCVPASADDWLASILEMPKIQPKSILKYIFARNVLAFIVEAEYDEVFGLKLTEEGGLKV